MRYRRIRRRSMTKAQLRIQEQIDRKTARQCVLLNGIAAHLPRVWDRKELNLYLDIIASEVIPLMAHTETLEERLRGRTRKTGKPNPKPRRAPKQKA